jgi:hypothetical protein
MRSGALTIGVLLLIGGCAQDDTSEFPVEYEVTVREGNPDRVAIEYSRPDGSSVRANITEHWKSPELFPRGEAIRLSARAYGDSRALVQCHVRTITEDDPDGTVFFGGGGLT